MLAFILLALHRLKILIINDVVPNSDLILCQSIVRRFLASRGAARFQNRVAAATLIQATYRKWEATQDFLYTISCIIIVQSIARTHLACRQFNQLKAAADKKVTEEYLVSVAAAIKIATCWRRFHCQNKYRSDVKGEFYVWLLLTD